tara:strand:+ start:5958 stop:6776 length:819 start_codon:yes stop_codon:yes gene_type:complete
MAPKLGIIAGGGDLPWLLREACKFKNRDCVFLALNGNVEESRLPTPDNWIRIGDWGKNLDLLHELGVKDLVLAGTVRRPGLKELRPDSRGAVFLTRLGRLWFGDNSILSAVVDELETEGFRVVSPESLLDGFISKEGAYGQFVPSAEEKKDINRGIEVLKTIGELDIGQAVVVQQEIVLAVEAAEGTDELIRRSSSLCRDGGGGVLVKFAKPNQERRVDLPTIGVQTIMAARDAGLAGIAVEAGGALVIDEETITKIADENSMFLIGVKGAS